MCVMLKGLAGFYERTNQNKDFAKPFAACRDRTGKRWRFRISRFTSRRRIPWMLVFAFSEVSFARRHE
jgi:hypothetical protein